MLAQIGTGKRPPLDAWNPALSGRIDILIDGNGNWFHDGTAIERFELVKLFASILRYEDDYGFVLVTPIEKWQIAVEDAPFIAVAMASNLQGDVQVLRFVTNVGEEVCVGAEHRLVFDVTAANPKPYIQVRPGLTAKLSRPVYYQLVDLAVLHGGRTGVWSSGTFFPID
jgi:hypothetical protein